MVIEELKKNGIYVDGRTCFLATQRTLRRRNDERKPSEVEGGVVKQTAETD
jgi:hypothetical protein